jgi:hypothetical protein
MARALTDLAGATRLARAIASDLSLYNNAAIEQGLREGRPFAGMDDELIEARHLFLRRVSARLDPLPLLVRALQEMCVHRAAQQGLATDGLAEAVAARLDGGGDRLALLVVDGGHDLGRVIPLADGVQEIGRVPAADIQIVGAPISRRHARLIVDGARVEVEDADSTCGIFVNDEQVRSAPLAVGDRLKLGTVDVTLIRVAAALPAVDPTHGQREAPTHTRQREAVLMLPGQDAAVRAEALRVAATGEPVATRVGQVQASLSIRVTHRRDTDATGPEALLERAWAGCAGHAGRDPVR